MDIQPAARDIRLILSNDIVSQYSITSGQVKPAAVFGGVGGNSVPAKCGVTLPQI